MASNTTFVSGAILTAAQMNNLGFGVMGYVSKIDANFAITTVSTTITGSTITFTGIAGRLYKASFNGLSQKGTADNIQTFKIFKGATQISQSSQYLVSGAYYIPNGFALFTATGSTSMTVTATADSGTGTLYCGAVNPFYFVIEDIGIA